MDSETPRPSLAVLMKRDSARGFGLALVACLVASILEYGWTATLAIKAWSSAGESVAIATLLRLLCLNLTLWLLCWPLVGLVVSGAGVVIRIFLRIFAGDRAHTWPGLLSSHAAPDGDSKRLAGWLWALAICSIVYVLFSAELTLYVGKRFSAPRVEALLLAGLQVMLVAGFSVLGYALYRGVRWAGELLESRLGRWNPLSRPDIAIAALVLLALVALRIVMAASPALAPLLPWRHLLAGAFVLFGLGFGRWLSKSRDGLLPREPKIRLAVLAGLLFAGALLVPLSLLRIGAEVHTKFVASAHSPPIASMMSMVRRANDFDGDGFGSLLGENDCAPFDAAIRPGIRDIPDNGVDENCDGRDFSFSLLPPVKRGEDAPVPADFQKPWNVLLVTIDTVRYDHTSFGGYIETAKRDTTPRLAQLVEQSVSFRFANAPSAGTMASIPAILTSKFFHSGIALGPDRKGMPPILKDSNVLLPEILKRGGYFTGAILSHVYFNDWGMEQGFDTYDNELGKKKDPHKVTSMDVTDRALEWIARNHRRKWFLWAHYIDPHGRYVAHPGHKSFGAEEMDLYDGELHFTDKHVGRLLDELANVPGGERTIVIITSDHGDGFKEHGFINHGMALYRELLHVPLIWYIPGAQPREAKGAVSPLDIVPTVAALTGIDTSDLSFEGESLVPQLFYGKDDTKRVVFAETNWPKPLRAAISEKFKLIYDLKSNVYQLYDLEKDAWEKRNIWKKNRKASDAMKKVLDDWLERVYYARDFEANQVTRGQLAGTLLEKKPAPREPLDVTFDRGKITLLGVDRPAGPWQPRQKVEVSLYFAVSGTPSGTFPISVELWSKEKSLSRSRVVHAGGGLFPTSRWRSGDFVKVVVSFSVPRVEATDAVLGVRLRGTKPVASAQLAQDPAVALVGPAQLGSSAAQKPRKSK